MNLHHSIANMNIEDYRNAPSGIGPLAAEWDDKPHRLIYDLCNKIEELRKINANLNEHIKYIHQQ